MMTPDQHVALCMEMADLRIRIHNAESGGAGFKLLRVPNT